MQTLTDSPEERALSLHSYLIDWICLCACDSNISNHYSYVSLYFPSPFKQEEELLKKLNWTGGSTPEEVNSFNDSFSEIQG